MYEAANNFAQALSSAGGYMAERVRDIQDVRDRSSPNCSGSSRPVYRSWRRPSVLASRGTCAADTAGLDPARVLALVTEEGGPTSHTAILARALRIPAVVAVKGALSFEAEAVSVDGDTGVVTAVAKDAPVVTATEAAGAEWNGVGATSDGRRVKVLANVGAPADARAAAETGAEGVGLFRTEFCYLDVDSEPTVDEQRAAYAAVLEPFAGKPVIVRTLDAGADKPSCSCRRRRNPTPRWECGVSGCRSNARVCSTGSWRPSRAPWRRRRPTCR